MNAPSICLTIDSRIENVRLVGAAIHRLCRLTSLPKEAVHRVELCVTEAVVNCLKHAYGSRTDQQISTTFTLTTEELRITVSDRGDPMTPDLAEKIASARDLNNPKVAPVNIAASGRGLSIILAFMDRVAYRSSEDGNHLIMRKLIKNCEYKDP